MRLPEPSSPPAVRDDGSVDVLVVEDDDDIRETLAETLAIEGFAVTTARNGREALESIRRALPRVLVLDLMMPEMSGWELLERIKDDDVLRKIPVLVMTAVHNAERPHGSPVFLKPLNVQSLIRAVRTFVVPEDE